METKGNIKKMQSDLNEEVVYSLPIGGQFIGLNEFIGKVVCIEHTGKINCIRCGRETKKSFAQGFCYPCFQSAPETEECVLRPELCKAHEGVARDMDFAKEHCLIDHYVYLANTSAIKVGVTRNTQIPTRWIDQGATQALIFAKTPVFRSRLLGIKGQYLIFEENTALNIRKYGGYEIIFTDPS